MATKIVFIIGANGVGKSTIKETIEQRIKSRYLTDESLAELARTTGKTVEKFIMDNIYVSSLLRKNCNEIGCAVVATSGRTPEDTAKEVVRLIQV